MTMHLFWDFPLIPQACPPHPHAQWLKLLEYNIWALHIHSWKDAQWKNEKKKRRCEHYLTAKHSILYSRRSDHNDLNSSFFEKKNVQTEFVWQNYEHKYKILT